MVGKVLAPETSPRPQMRPQNSIGDTLTPQDPSQRESFMQRIMSDPVKSALWLQTAAGLLASRGLGPSVGMGLEAAGRAAGNMANVTSRAEQEAQRRKEVLARGKGKGKAGDPGATSDNPLEYFGSKKFRDRAKFYLDLLKDSDSDEVMGMSPEELVGRANMLAAQEAGFTEGVELYNGATSEEDRALIAREFMNPQKAYGQIVKARTGMEGTQGPDALATPEIPESPQIASPKIVTPNIGFSGMPNRTAPGLPGYPSQAPANYGGAILEGGTNRAPNYSGVSTTPTPEQDASNGLGSMLNYLFYGSRQRN